MAAAEVLSVLAELEYSLRSKPNPQERITSEEESVLRNLKEGLVDTFLMGGLVSSIVCWTGTRRFGYGPRILYSAGAGFLGGTWACKWNLRSSLDPIIAADGSRMQRELANIMIVKQQTGQLRPSFISRHLYKLFYPEHVFLDSHPDKLYTRWRLRNTYQENFDGVILQKLSTESLEPTTWATTQRSQKQEMRAELNKRSQRQEVKAEQLNNTIQENPLDCILGFPGDDQEAQSNNRIVRSRKGSSHSHRRAHRRHRACDRKAEGSEQFVQTTE